MDFESFEKEFVEKVQEIQKGKPIKIKDFKKHFGLK